MTMFALARYDMSADAEEKFRQVVGGLDRVVEELCRMAYDLGKSQTAVEKIVEDAASDIEYLWFELQEESGQE